MRFNRFKAEILNVTTRPLPLPEFNKPIDKTFEFSKHRIFFTEEQTKMHLLLERRSDGLASSVFENRMKYTLDKVYDNNDRLRFQITVGTHNYCSFIKLSWYDKIICNIIHERYIISREWFYKTLITATIGFLFALIGTYVGYHQGYQSGLKEGKAMHQDTTRQH